MPRTRARLERLVEYAWDRWHASEYLCDLWWRCGMYGDMVLRDHADDARYIVQEPDNETAEYS